METKKGYPGILQKKKLKTKKRISQDIPKQKQKTLGYPFLVKDIPGYPDVWDIPADISSFWDISSNPDLTRLILTCPTGTDSSRGICTRGISIV